MIEKQNQKNKMSWLKGVLSSRSDANNEDNQSEVLSSTAEDNVKEILDQVDTELETLPIADDSKNNLLFSKDNQDKITLDLVAAVENVLKDRQLGIFKNKGLEEQIHNANETISRLKSEQKKKEQIIWEKEKEVANLEEKLTNRQMNYDQLLEDYKEYQNTSNIGLENLKYQLDKEVNRYAKLDEEFSKYQYETMQKTRKMEEKIRELEVENQKVSNQYQKLVEEKNQLLQTINDFTERMAFSFSNSNKS